jgi:hypothetical protein
MCHDKVITTTKIIFIKTSKNKMKPFRVGFYLWPGFVGECAVRTKFANSSNCEGDTWGIYAEIFTVWFKFLNLTAEFIEYGANGTDVDYGEKRNENWFRITK